MRGKIAGLPAKGSDKFIDDWVALEEDSVKQLHSLTGGYGADVVLDTVGGVAMFETAMAHLKTRGTLVEISATGGPKFFASFRSGEIIYFLFAWLFHFLNLYLMLAGAQVSLNLVKFYRQELRLFGVNSLNQTSAESAELLSEVVRGIEAGALQAPTKIRGVPLERAAEVYEAVGGGSEEKLVLLPHPDEGKL